jgi:hypothetical protein
MFPRLPTEPLHVKKRSYFMSKPERSISPREVGLVPEDPADFDHYYERAREICRRAKGRAQVSDDELIVLAVVASQLALAKYVEPGAKNADSTLDAILDILDRGDVVQAMSAKMTQLLSRRAATGGMARKPLTGLDLASCIDREEQRRPQMSVTAHAVTEVPASKTEITTDEEAEIQYWTQLFGVNRHQLINAIQIVGTSVKDVKKFLETGNEPAPGR